MTVHNEYEIVVEDEDWLGDEHVEYESMNDVIKGYNVTSRNEVKYEMVRKSMLDHDVNSLVSGNTTTTTSTSFIEDAYNYTHRDVGEGVESRVPLLLSYDAENSARYWNYGAQHSRQGNSQAYFYGHEYEQDESLVYNHAPIVLTDDEYDARKHFQARNKQTLPFLITTDKTHKSISSQRSYYRRYDDTLCLPLPNQTSNSITLTDTITNLTIDSSLPSHDNTSRTSSIQESIYSEDYSSLKSDNDTKNTQQPQQYFLSSPTMTYLKRKQQKQKTIYEAENNNPLSSCIDIFDQIENNCAYYNNAIARTPSTLSSYDENNNHYSKFYFLDVIYNFLYKV